MACYCQYFAPLIDVYDNYLAPLFQSWYRLSFAGETSVVL
jgi:hypothetical protein